MCGIFGAIGKYDMTKVKMLALLNESRGKDSWGYYNGKHIFRGMGEIRDGINTFRASDAPILLGHTRFKTTGAVKIENAHPFRFGNVIGAHNGVVSNHVELEKTYGKEELEVDSQIIFWGLNEFGTDFLKKVEAYWGLWWMDLKEPYIVNLSNHEHELALGRDRQALYFASNMEDLKRIGVKETWKIKNNKLYRIDVRSLKISKETLKGLKGYSSWKAYGTYGTSYGTGEWNPHTGLYEYGAKDTGKLLHWPEKDSTRPALSYAEQKELDELEEKFYSKESLTPMEELRYEKLIQKERDGDRLWA